MFLNFSASGLNFVFASFGWLVLGSCLSPTAMNFSEKLIVDDNALFKIKNEIQAEFSHGLNYHGTDVSMIPTFVYGLPDGTECGTYLSLDLGGTNMRVCEVNLSGDRNFSISQEKYKITEDLKTGEFTELFSYMAKSIGHFISTKSQSKKGQRIPLGFTFSCVFHADYIISISDPPPASPSISLLSTQAN